jgi:hypothetical protein
MAETGDVDLWSYINPRPKGTRTPYPVPLVLPDPETMFLGIQFTELDADQRSTLALSLSFYKEKNSVTQRILSKSQKIVDFIFDTVDINHLLLLKDSSNASDMLTALARRLAPNDQARTLEVEFKYASAKVY